MSEVEAKWNICEFHEMDDGAMMILIFFLVSAFRGPRIYVYVDDDFKKTVHFLDVL